MVRHVFAIARCSVIAFCAVSPSAADETATGMVVSVHDGDTLTAMDAGNVQHKVRLTGIDAPEIGQPFGTKARDRLTALAKGKTVTIHGHGQDRYGGTRC